MKTLDIKICKDCKRPVTETQYNRCEACVNAYINRETKKLVLALHNLHQWHNLKTGFHQWRKIAPTGLKTLTYSVLGY